MCEIQDHQVWDIVARDVGCKTESSSVQKAGENGKREVKRRENTTLTYITRFSIDKGGKIKGFTTYSCNSFEQLFQRPNKATVLKRYSSAKHFLPSCSVR